MPTQESIDRKEFLMQMGFRGGALMALLTGCVREEDTYIEAQTVNANGQVVNNNVTPTTPTNPNNTNTNTNTGGTTVVSKTITTEELNKITNVKLKLDLSQSANANLKKDGGYIINTSIVVALNGTEYVAATQTCTHEPKKKIIFSNKEWYCTDHGARFTLKGVGLNSLGSKGLSVYNVATDGKTLVVY